MAGPRKNRSAYIKEFQGKKLISHSLPQSAELQAVLGRINDEFTHLNPSYYFQHAELLNAESGTIDLRVHYFDRDPIVFEAHLLAFLHLVVALQHSLAGLLSSIFPNSEGLDVKVSALEAVFEGHARELLERRPEVASVLEELGLWKVASRE